ncbi:excalibur calcium-binding domain-containing protein [Priestia megaterium]
MTKAKFIKTSVMKGYLTTKMKDHVYMYADVGKSGEWIQATFDDKDNVVKKVEMSPNLEKKANEQKEQEEQKAKEEAQAEQARKEAEAQAQAQQQQQSQTVYFKNCTEARAAGAAPVYQGQPGYAKHLDRDGDGVGCDQ